MDKHKINEIKKEENKLLNKIESLKGDMFLIYGYARQLEEIRQELKQSK